ncbi:restriction endonuclease [Motilibacter aurantiacus]|uniref:restriction endonuclease n=1 Tax=Motilibacter aurantiacus TaxID=2714955 RepID=UPI00140DF849|nr:restriction endonuclease [Motilibacter aurantiacus]NHC47133.1 restriction endonuclease [Motilibacter aurantiacus]
MVFVVGLLLPPFASTAAAWIAGCSALVFCVCVAWTWPFRNGRTLGDPPHNAQEAPLSPSLSGGRRLSRQEVDAQTAAVIGWQEVHRRAAPVRAAASQKLAAAPKSPGVSLAALAVIEALVRPKDRVLAVAQSPTAADVTVAVTDRESLIGAVGERAFRFVPVECSYTTEAQGVRTARISSAHGGGSVPGFSMTLTDPVVAAAVLVRQQEINKRSAPHKPAAPAGAVPLPAPRLDPPPPRLIRTARDAELNVAAWMRFWGFSDAQVMPVGPDAGIDVISSSAVAQVKMEGVPTGRPVVQQLHGVAQHAKRRGLLFSLAGYTEQARAWAEDAGVALFRFDFQGVPEPVNGHAASVAEA